MVQGTRAVLGRFKICSYNLLLKVSETGVNSSFIRNNLSDEGTANPSFGDCKNRS